jgi:hypothetical protein
LEPCAPKGKSCQKQPHPINKLSLNLVNPVNPENMRPEGEILAKKQPHLINKLYFNLVNPVNPG